MARLLASRDPGTIREALVRRGMDASSAALAADGIRPVTLFIDSVDAESQDLLAQAALLKDLELVRGDGWVAVSGSPPRIAGLARTSSAGIPEALRLDLASCLNRVTNLPTSWITQRGSVAIDSPVVVGILNVTPDSFSDGGRFLDPEAAIRHAEHLIESGADMIDVGGESTRPGRPKDVSADEEWNRLGPVIDYLRRTHPAMPISVDTVKSVTAEMALDAGAWVINDVSTLRLDSRIADVCAAFGAGMIISHSRGSFSEMAGYEHASYGDVTAETADELMVAVDVAVDRGMPRERIVLDPGLGFAKTPEQCCELLRGLPFLASLGMPLMVGPSRKRFLGAITKREAHDRDAATAAACVAAFFGGAYLFRVHDVAGAKEALAVAAALRSM